jgi:hypothetical protein
MLSGTFILAETMAAAHARRFVRVVLLPPVPSSLMPTATNAAAAATSAEPARYGVTVVRTLTSIKTYARARLVLGASSAVAMGPGWVGALAAAATAGGDMARTSEDPSPALSAWDKLVRHDESASE